MCHSLIICISLLLCFSNLANAQSVHDLGIEHGLSNKTVTAFHKNKFGLMWLGTKDGLNRYDGYLFKIFRNRHQDSTSLPDDITNCLTSDVDGNIGLARKRGWASWTFVLNHLTAYVMSMKLVKRLNSKTGSII